MLIGMAICVAFVTSAVTSLGLFSLDFWWELAALIVIVLLGRQLDGDARDDVDDQEPAGLIFLATSRHRSASSG